MPKSTEKATQKTVLDHLLRLGIPATRMQSGMVWAVTEYSSKKFPIHLCTPGMPDVMAFWRQKTYALEVKDKSGQLRETQKRMRERLEREGVVWVTVKNISQIIDIFGDLPKAPKPPRAIPEVPSCGHRRKSHFHAPSGKTLCLPCIEKLECN